MTMTKFTRDAVFEALHAAVAAKGEDYVYPSYKFGCYYADSEEHAAPSCIVGHVVARLDRALFENWAEFEKHNQGDSFSVHESAGSVEYGSGPIYDEDGYIVDYSEPQKVRKALDVDEVTQDALLAAQNLQDRGHSWARAQEAFDRVMAGEDREAVENEILLRR